MDDKATKILRSAGRANSQRQNWINVLDDVWDYCFPMRQGFYQEAPGQERMEKIFDETPIDAAAEFASIIQEGLFNGKWFRLVPGPAVPADQHEQIQAELDVVNDYIYQVLDQTNMGGESYEALLEMAASVGNLYISEGNAIKPIRFQAVSMIHLDYEVGPDGYIDTVFRTRKIKAKFVETEYPDATLPQRFLSEAARNPDKEIEILETCRLLREEIGTETHEFTVMLKKDKKIIEEKIIKGDGSRPWINFRWAADSGCAFGRGPLITALPSIRNLNLVKEMGLENAQLHIGGIFQADDDGTYNFDNVEIVPMSVMSRTPGTKGLEPVALPGNPDMTQFVIQDLQNSIRMILLNAEFGSLDKTPRAVQEIAGRMGKQMRKIRAPLIRLVNELVFPSAKRIVYLLKKQGLIELPKIDGKGIKLVARGPLIRMLAALEQEDMVEFTMMVKQMMGPESRLYVDDAAVVRHMAKNKELPSDILVSQADRDVLLAQMQNTVAEIEGEPAPETGTIQ